MKALLTKEQSQHLIELGVPFNKTSVNYSAVSVDSDIKRIVKFEYFFTLTNLLEILPKEIEGKYGLTPIVITFGGIYKSEPIDKWFTYYDDVTETIEICAEELIDALYELLCWVIENGYLKFD